MAGLPYSSSVSRIWSVDFPFLYRIPSIYRQVLLFDLLFLDKTHRLAVLEWYIDI